MWSVCALSIGKACAAVPACAVVAGGRLARLAAVVLALWRTLPAVAGSVAAGGVVGCGWYCTLAAFLGARWRPFCGPCGVVAGVGLSLPLAWPLRAARGWRWRGLDRLRVVLARRCGLDRSSRRRCGCWCIYQARPPPWPLWWPWWRCAGGVVRLSMNVCGWRCWRCRCIVVAVAGVEPAAPLAVPNGHGRGPCGPW